ncbi:MAG: methylated-DNA--protein-cysteine methyltransferase [Alphaproteobacteria bacterium]|nr:MAG: methylated-DNA--protein-cysteine methyltransferase [Alphaproteobacteria bacterium]
MAEPRRLVIDRLGTPLGELLIVADAVGRLCAIEWSDQEDRLRASLRLQNRAGGYVLTPAASATGNGAALAAYFRGDLAAIDELDIADCGTPFQRAVWQALRRIPCGGTVSYAALAQRIGRPAAVRAVGHANGANPVSIVVPCHRVIGSDGSLTGYGGGIERKRWLLAHERARLG